MIVQGGFYSFREVNQSCADVNAGLSFIDTAHILLDLTNGDQ